MANVYEPSEEQAQAWDAWVAERPPAVRAVAERFKPWKLYRYGQKRVTIDRFCEPDDGGPITLYVHVSPKFNFVICERLVFGVYPDQLTECDLPAPDELVGTFDDVLTQLTRDRSHDN